MCVGGDSDGPYNGECEYFAYKTCKNLGCQAYESCDRCIAEPDCGWCDNGGYCLNGKETDTGSCNIEFFYSLNFPGRDHCTTHHKPSAPRYENFDLYVNSDPTGSIDRVTSDSLIEIDLLRRRAVEITSQIQELEQTRARVIQEAEEGREIELPEILIPYFNKGIWRKVETFARAEMLNSEGTMSEATDELKEYIEKMQKEAKDMAQKQQIPTVGVPITNIPSETPSRDVTKRA